VDLVKGSKLRSAFVLAGISIIALVLIQPPSAIGQTSTGGLRDGGVLRLRLGATDHLRWEPTAGSATGAVTQPINVSGACGLSLGAGSLGSFTATGGSVGFVDDGIGVRGPGEGSGQPCGRIDGSQALTFQLGSGLTGRVADYLEADIEGKFNASFRIRAWLGSTEVTPADSTYSTMGPDSGPDSGDGDNFRVRFPKAGKVLFDKLTFTVLSGGVSLEGGADGTAPCSAADFAACGTFSLGQSLGTTDTLFHLVKSDGTLNCGASATEPSGGSNEPSIQFFRLDNIGGGACTPIPYDLETLSGEVDILKDLLGQQAQFRAVITWPATTEDYPVQASTIDYGAGPVTLEWCLADGTNGPADGFPDLPSGGHFYCLEKQEATDGLSTGLVTVKETLYGQLDPVIKRG
jgi:hypothetical protein